MPDAKQGVRGAICEAVGRPNMRFVPIKTEDQQAVRRVQSILKEGRRFTVDVDLSKFFDRVNHDLLMTHLGRKVRDKRLLGLIARYLRAGIIDNQLYLESREGVPQGGPLSPLLANIMLDPLDKELERRGHRFARYADDFTIVVNSRRAGDRVLASISHFLEHRLKLTVNTTICGSLDPTHRCRVLWELGVRSPPGYPIMFRFLVIRAVSHSARLV